MTRADAARVLDVNKSTISRWVEKHPALLGDDGLVSLSELRAHRAQMINPALQTAVRNEAVRPRPAARADAQPSLNDHRARSERAKAVQNELDLADRLKLTLVREDVERQIAAAGEVIKRRAGELAKDRA